MILLFSVECEVGRFVDFEFPGLPFNGVIRVPEVAASRVVPSLWIHGTYPESGTGPDLQISIRELRISSPATYYYEAERIWGRLYLARRAIARDGLTVEFWSY